MTGPSVTKPVKQLGYRIVDQASSLEAEPLAAYLELLRDGSPAAISEAIGIHPHGRKDASEVVTCREALALIAEAEATRPAAVRDVAKLDDKLIDVRAKIERLQEVERELTQKIGQASNAVPHADGFRRRVRMIANNAIVRLALADELQAAGV